MKPLGGPMGLGWVGATLFTSTLVSALASAGCSSPFSVGTTTTTTGTGGTGGTSATGGTGTGTGGGATGCSPSPCPADQYCDPSSWTCQSCAQSSRFSFGTPVAIPLTLEMPGSGALYPRVDPGTGELYLVQQAQGTHLNQLASAPYMASKMPPWTGAGLLQGLAGSHQDSGPLPLQDPLLLDGIAGDGLSKLGKPVLLFDSDRTAGQRRIFGVGIQQAKNMSPQASPAQLNLPGNATRESRIAVAMDASPYPRFFWISNGGASTADHLVTSTAAGSTATSVPIMLDTGCPVPLADTPWVTPSGDRLLFSSAQYDNSPACTGDATVTHLYHVPLDGSGQPTAMASRVFPKDTSTDTTPSLTPNRCTLLFSRVDGGTVKVYAATRN